jgi:oxygen-independent coproporphyrinogen-3 oxidase
MTKIPLSLYIHIPWCVQKCPYCDFNSHPVYGDAIPEAEYMQALLKDLAQDAETVCGRELASIFIGGGTPSLMSPDAIARLLDSAAQYFHCPNDLEITLEANPGAVDAGFFKGYRNAGVNRLSLGIQSFNDKALQSLGRVHDSAQAKRAVYLAQQVGFDNFNLDMMFGLPQQTLDAAQADLQAALSLAPTHISWYQLTLEQHTAFCQNPPPGLPDDDLLWDMQQAGQKLLHATQYQHYEISGYAREGMRCQHNLNYWQFGDYLGVGAGAHGKMTQDGKVRRSLKPKHPNAYMSGKKTTWQDVAQADLALEFMLNALRLKDGFAAELFAQRTGLALDSIAQQLKQCEQAGWLLMKDGWIRPTDSGQQFLNEMLAVF